MTLFEVTENFCRLSRTAKRFEIFSQNFEVTSTESRNLAEMLKTRKLVSLKIPKVLGSQLLPVYIGT